MSVLAQPNRRPAALVLAGVLFAGGLVAVSLGVYAHAHTPGGRPLFQFGFSGMLQLKAWFSTAVLVLLVVQVVTALWMWGRLPGVAAGGSAVAWSHRWSGTAAFVLSLPVAVHCLWALGFGVGSTRVIVHGVAGCAFYGAYAAKMLGLRVRGMPAGALPWLGAAVFTTFVVAWLSASLWFFTRSGLPLT